MAEYITKKQAQDIWRKRGEAMNREELNKILENHKHWIMEDCEGWENMRADLCGATLYEADLYEADLREANLCGAENFPFIPMACPDKGSFIGYKKAHNLIVELEICEDARRSSATARKCRCDKAKVVSITTVNGEDAEVTEIASDRDEDFIYKVGEIVEEPNFCEDRFRECAGGIHFFINRQEAIDY